MHAWLPIGGILSLSWAACAAAPDPAAAALAGMDLETKAGQLFVAWSLSRPEGDNHERLLAAVRDAGLGGVILSLGTVDEAAALIPRLQAAAKVPLLLASDFEGGVWARLRGGTELGNQMLVGATGSARLAEAMGRVTAREAKALGFHWVLAPVLDVNSNPDNPIINVRSFGEDPQRVATLGCAFASGVQQEGLLACGKHFPGHGDVDSDSHLALPTVPGDAARLRAVELVPFAAAARAGIASIMTGHLAVPGLGEQPDVPATLSHYILTDVLRGELGFDGLIVTDALDMGGVKNALPPGEVAVRALLAGADVLLMPPDPLAARAAVVEAVRSGRVPMARLDEAVRRILRAKAKVGLFDAERGPPAATGAGIESDLLASEIAARGVTLVRDRDGALPLPTGANDGAVLVTLLDQDEGQGRLFAKFLEVAAPAQVRLLANSSAADVAAVAQQVAAARIVVLSLCIGVREFQGGIGLPPSLRPVLDALRAEQRVIAVSFGNPYLIRHLPQVDAYLAAYVSTGYVENLAAAALLGEQPLTGRLPVAIPGVAAAGSGLTQLPGRDVVRGGRNPAFEGLDPALPARVRTLLERAVGERAFPGAVCFVARRGVAFAEVAVGRVGYDAGAEPVTPDTCYDLASLTKVCATLPSVLKLAANGTLSLDDPVAKWLPAFQGAGKAEVTIGDLLRHRSGLPAWRPYFRTLHERAAIVAAAAAEPLVGGLHERVYSDLNFLLLGAIVEAASGESLAAFAQREVFAPLGMRQARFAVADAPPLDAAPTEQGTVRGRVHDENASAMGGVAGHAGLFATADDVLRLGVMMLAGGRGVLPRDLVAQATGGDRPLGFDVAKGGTFSHTGFTGTWLWCDPRDDLCVVLLTNRVHPSRDNDKITAVRRELHALVLDSLR